MSLTPNSSVPYQYIFGEINSPLVHTLVKGGYDNYVLLADRLVALAKELQVLSYSQNLSGICIEQLYEYSYYPKDSPEYETFVKYTDIIVEQNNIYAEINDMASVGAFNTPVEKREESSIAKANLTSFVNGLMKDTVVSLSDHRGSVFVDIKGGDGDLLKTAAYMKVDDFSTYVNVDVNPAVGNNTFEATLRAYDNPAVVPLLKKEDPSHHIRTHRDDNQNFFSIHSVYNLDYEARVWLRSRPFSGVAFVSDLLFMNGDVEDCADFHVMHRDGVVTGKIGNYELDPENMLFAKEIGIVYPARFIHSARAPCESAPAISNSLCFWSPYLSHNGRDLPGRPGKPFVFSPNRRWSKFRRIKCYTIEPPDFYFLHQMGYYVSAKLDGMAGSIGYASGAYTLTFRDGLQTNITFADGTLPSWGVFQYTVNVEVFPGKVDGTYEIWYVGRSPDVYPSEPDKRKDYYRSKYSAWSGKLNEDKQNFKGLFFKPYYFVQKLSDFSRDILMHDDLAPLSAARPGYDGLILMDPYGAFVSYWKPHITHELRVTEVDGKLLGSTSLGDSVPVFDPRRKFVGTAVYEALVSDGQMIILHYRSDKNVTGIVPIPSEPVFDVCDGHVILGEGEDGDWALRVQFKAHELDEYLVNYGKAYKTVALAVASVNVSPGSLLTIWNLLNERLTSSYYCNNGCYIVSDFIEALQSVTSLSPQPLWAMFVRSRLMPRNNGPFDPHLRFINGAYHAVVSLDPHYSFG